MQTVAESKFDHLGVFAYSPEEGTAAFDRKAPDIEVAEERCRKVMALQKKIVAERAKTLKGKTDTVLLLSKGPKDVWQARLPRQAPEVDGVTWVHAVHASAKPGDFVHVEITGVKGFDLLARNLHSKK